MRDRMFDVLLPLGLATVVGCAASAFAPASAAAPAQAAAHVQSWGGGYLLNGHHSSMSLRVTGLGTSPSITASMLIKGLSDVPLTEVTWRDGHFTGKLKESDGTDSFDGRQVGNEIAGTVTKNGSKGTFGLIRLADMPEDMLRSYEGAYRGRDGTYLIERLWVGHWMINMAEERAGTFRGIFPVGPGHFVAGPALLTPAPVRWDLRFSPRTLTIKHAGRTDVARRLPLRSEDVTFMDGDVRLAGTLVEPKTPGPHPAIVFMHGSGAAPRQSNFGLGYWLAAQGFAVLKYDKRGSGQSGGDLDGIRYEQLGEDGAAAARWLRARPEIDRKRIGFWGISEGGWTAPLAATQFKAAAFVIVASGGALSPAAGELLDTEDQLKTDGRFSSAQITDALNFQRLRDAYMHTGQGWDAYVAALKSAVKQPWWNYPSTDLYGWSKPDSAAWKMKAASYFYDPVPTLKALRCPILFIYGALDTPAGVRADLSVIHQVFGDNRNAQATVRVFPETSHNLFVAKTGNENNLDDTTRFSPDYFPTITSWLLEQTVASARQERTR